MCDECKLDIGRLCKSSIFYSATRDENVDIDKIYVNYSVKDSWGNTFYGSKLKLAQCFRQGYEDEYKWKDKIIKKAFIQKVEVLRDIDILVSNCNDFKTGRYTYAFKRIINICINYGILPKKKNYDDIDKTRFMNLLGDKKYMFQCYHDTEGNWEYLVPYQLMKPENFRMQNTQDKDDNSKLLIIRKDKYGIYL